MKNGVVVGDATAVVGGSAPDGVVEDGELL